MRLIQLSLQPRHQVFSILQPRLLFAQADVSLGNALLCGLMRPAAVIRLLLHCYTDPASEPRHVYLREAESLRRDLLGAQ